MRVALFVQGSGIDATRHHVGLFLKVSVIDQRIDMQLCTVRFITERGGKRLEGLEKYAEILFCGPSR